MKAEEFDQYVRAQFQGDAAAPPAGMEQAVFAAVAAERTGRRRAWSAAALLMAAAAGTALWLTAPEPAASLPVQDAPVESVAPVQDEAVASPDAFDRAEPSIVEEAPAAAEATETQTPSSEARTAMAQPTHEPEPEILEPVASRGVASLSTDEKVGAAELQQKERETWVLPAVVKVND